MSTIYAKIGTNGRPASAVVASWAHLHGLT